MKNILVVVTGVAGAGKDFIINEFIKTEAAQKLGLRKIRTNADRPRRDTESEDAYYFISKTELDRLNEDGLLAEEIIFSGFSRKATSKTEILRIFDNQNLLWRVDPSLAVKIAKGNYFEKYFLEHATTLKELTLLIHIHAPQEVVDKRRKERDLDKYNPLEYKARDAHEKPHIDLLLKSSNVEVIENVSDGVNVVLNKISKIIVNHYRRINSISDI